MNSDPYSYPLPLIRSRQPPYDGLTNYHLPPGALLRHRETYPDPDHIFDEDEEDEAFRARHSVAVLRDRHIERPGDFGWKFDFAVAFCYRHITGNRSAIVSAINQARRAPPSKITPYLLFDSLDRAVFAGRLNEVVYIAWRPQEVDHPGTTYLAGMKAGRVCIELNSTPFGAGADIDDMLRMLLHHMIHAYFMVSSGAPKLGEKLDGRLLDGVQFGVIVLCINDITQDCELGSLGLIFHAHRRQADAMPMRRHPESFGHSYIALDPSVSNKPMPACEGHTCCSLDNRTTTLAHVYNWQVEEYSKAISEKWDTRDDYIYLPQNGNLFKHKRTSGPPSSGYIELIWDDKRIAVSKKQSDKYSTLARMGSDNKFDDVKLPECSAEVLSCLWTFIEHGCYAIPPPYGHEQACPISGPPVLLSPHSRQGDDVTIHVRVCKLADAMRFPELRAEAVRQLYHVPATDDDPVTILRLVYEGSVPLSSELQTWSRKFLARSDGQTGPDWGMIRPGVSNYQKIIEWHLGRFEELYHKHPALRDDCKLAVASMAAGFTWGPEEGDIMLPTNQRSMHPMQQLPVAAHPRLLPMRPLPEPPHMDYGRPHPMQRVWV